MASKRRLRRKQCQRKQPLTRQAAMAMAATLRRQSGTDWAIDAYRCQIDPSHWHVGHRPRRVQRVIEKRRVTGG
jgi:hypothetical protein